MFLPTTVSTRVTVTASKAGIPQFQNHSLDRLRTTFLYSNKITRTMPTRSTPPATQTEPSKARGNSCGRFPVEISHENFITGSSKARQGAAPLSPLRHLPTTGCPRKILISEISGSQIHIWQLWTNNVPPDICQLTLRYLHSACQGTLVI